MLVLCREFLVISLSSLKGRRNISSIVKLQKKLSYLQVSSILSPWDLVWVSYSKKIVDRSFSFTASLQKAFRHNLIRCRSKGKGPKSFALLRFSSIMSECVWGEGSTNGKGRWREKERKKREGVKGERQSNKIERERNYEGKGEKESSERTREREEREMEGELEWKMDPRQTFFLSSFLAALQMVWVKTSWKLNSQWP